jgi:sugar lactone lactonase YvrE
MDEDGDALNFLWYAGEGSISNQLGRILYWSAPSKLGTCEIKVFVKDNKGGKADGEVEVEVISFIPSPALSPRGLAADGECIWCAAGGKVYRVDPSDGEIISSLTTPGELPRGLAWGDGFLFIADSATDKIYKMDVSSGSFEEYPLPGEDLIPSGLAFDGENLWVSDYDKNALYKLTPDGEVLDKFPSPGSSPRGLTFSEEGYLLGVDSGDDDLVYKIDPLSGEPLTSFSTPSTNPRGLALMDNLLFIADWDKNQIYKMIVDN